MIQEFRRPTALMALTGLGLAIAYGIAPVPSIALVLILLGWICLALVDPRSGIVSTLAALPLYHRPLETAVGTYSPSELLLAVTAAATFVHVVLPVHRIRYVHSVPGWAAAIRSRPVWIALILSVAGAIALLTVDDVAARDAGLRELRWTLVEPLVLIVLLVTWCRSRRERYYVALVWAAAILVSMLPAMLDPVRGAAVEAGGVLRVSGMYPHPNAMALAANRGVVFIVALLATHRMLASRLIFPVIAFIGLLLATFARSAFVAFGAVALLFAWRAGRRARNIATVTIAAGIALLAVAAPDRLLDGLAGGSLDLRVDIWRAGLAMIRDNPILGLGPDQFFFNYAPRYVSPTGWGERFTSHAHNIVIDSWIRLGIIGAVFAVGALLMAARDAINLARGTFTGSRLQLAAGMALFAALLQGLVDNTYFVHDLAMSFWLLVWLRFEPNREEEGPRRNAGADFWWRRAGWIAPLRSNNR